jgi:hypothetical protein
VARGGGAARPRRGASALDVTRAFLDSYLAVSCGQAPPRALRRASANLRGSFERNPPHISARVGECDPRIISVRVQPAAPGRAVAVATVADGESEYAVTLALARKPNGWLVTGVGAS